MNKHSKFPELNKENEAQNRDKTLNEDLNAETNLNNLSYNESENSFEFDVDPQDGEYNHPDPYNTAVKNGGDSDSDYDEANPTAVEEYEDNDLEDDLGNLGMHIDNGKILEVSPVDEELSKTPEDDRDDLDEEGYPKNDRDKDHGDNMK